LVGGLGKAFVVIGDDAIDDTDAPDTFVARIVKVYSVLPVNPVTVIGDDDDVPVNPSGLLVAV
jgi:hypothetical protein